MTLSTQPGFGRSFHSDSRFPDPFCDVASLAMPRTIEDALLWAQYIFVSNGIYREAIGRVVSYFLTDVKVDDVEDANKQIGAEERLKYLGFLEDTLGIKDLLHTVAIDYLCYNNSFTSITVPFIRSLQCPQCGWEAQLRVVATTPQYNYKWQDFKFYATCPKCNAQGAWRRVDRRSGEANALRVKRWDPHEIVINHDELSDTARYTWRIPDYYRRKIREGDLHHLMNAPWEVVECVQENKNLEFADGYIYHMKEPCLAGTKMRGWGLPRVIVNFRQAYYFALLLRINETVALDYTIPFRVLTPEFKPGAEATGSDPVHTVDLGRFQGYLRRMLAMHRRDPAGWHTLPFSVKYQALGAEASQLAPKDLIEQAIDMLLTSIGVPIELFRGTLGVQAAPAALRLFEANWSHLTHRLNGFLTRIVQKISEVMNWELVRVQLERVTVSDDLNRQMAHLQLMMGQQVSKTTGLRSIGLDYKQEVRQQMEDERLSAEEADKMQKEMQQAQQMDELSQGLPGKVGQPLGGQTGQPAASPSPGGAPQPAPAGQPVPAQSAVAMYVMQRQNQPNVPRDPEDMLAQAQLLATDLLSKPESQRRGDLMRLKQVDPVMHQLVRSTMDDMRSQARSQGQELVMSQSFPKQAAYEPPLKYIEL